MDFNSLRDQVSNLTLYDLKAGVRKVQNAVMNYTEMESKVREATNNEPWGASSSMLQEIASATFNYQLLNEIMPMIYKRFTEKSAEEWRQIYKALQLMEFLVKHGSERVIDDARSHLSLLKMLRQFHYIDQNGKDQGINVRNRSKELTDLLSDVEKIRSERKKAKATRGKYGGVEGGMGLGGSSSSSGRYGGFGSESGGQSGGGYGGFSGGVYGDGGGFGGQEAGEDYDAPAASGRRGERFEEYDEYDEGAAAPSPSKRRTESSRSVPNRNKKQPEPPKPKAPEVDLFDFGDEPITTAPSASNGHSAAHSNDFGGFQAGGADDDDDFDDFQSAAPSASTAAVPKPAAASTLSSFATIAPPASTSTPSSSTQFAAPQPKVNKPSDFSNIFSTTSPPPQGQLAPTPAASISSFALPPAQSRPTGYQPSGPNYFTSVSAAQPSAAGVSSPPVSTPGSIGSGTSAAKKPAAGGDAFASLLSGSKFGGAKPAQSQGLSMQEMAKQKSSAGLWGAPAASPGLSGGAAPRQQQPPKSGGGGALDDLLG
ncbi:ENTH-domain-containing protein [Myriangium duriaei CBS 260.36]|uniref:ENTH-domain-containing protein n=1 Tax=Myriangium duriaei CBS 260.36 TaxID=1168546 RepID=A0A9P4MJ58_9PEZI|nr:ENTH-domain-containing protein [Myriangium duriaei CBS 260.36]